MDRIIDLRKKKKEGDSESKSADSGRAEIINWSEPPDAEKAPEGQAVLAKAENPEHEGMFNRICWSGFLHGKPAPKVALGISVFFWLLAAFVGFIWREPFTTILFGLSGVMVLVYSRRNPEVANFEIGPMGVRSGDKFYKYREIKSFWIDYEPEYQIKELSIQLKNKYSFYVKIPLHDQNPLQIRSALVDFVPEEEHKEPLLSFIVRRMGF